MRRSLSTRLLVVRSRGRRTWSSTSGVMTSRSQVLRSPAVDRDGVPVPVEVEGGTFKGGGIGSRGSAGGVGASPGARSGNASGVGRPNDAIDAAGALEFARCDRRARRLRRCSLHDRPQRGRRAARRPSGCWPVVESRHHAGPGHQAPDEGKRLIRPDRWLRRGRVDRIEHRLDLGVPHPLQAAPDLGQRQVLALEPPNETQPGEMSIAVTCRGTRRPGRREQALGDVVAHGARRDIRETGKIGQAVGVVRHAVIVPVLRHTVKTLESPSQGSARRGRSPRRTGSLPGRTPAAPRPTGHGRVP